MRINQATLYNLNHPNLNSSTPSFEKKLVEKTNVRKPWGEVERVKVVEYDPKNKKDRKQINNLYHKDWGRLAKYMYSIAYSFSQMTKGGAPEKPIKQQYFGIEDKYSNTLAIAQVQSSDKELRLGNWFFPNCTKITYIQTKPKEMFTSDRRTYEGLGETLIKEIVQIAQDEGRNSVILYSTNDNFWNNSGFFKPIPEARKGGYNIMRLEKEDFDNYIKFVNNKTSFENPYLDIYM